MSPALSRDELRKPYSKVLPPENYRGLKLEEICNSDVLRSRKSALDASTPSCVYASEVIKKQAKVARRRLTFEADTPGRHIAEIFTGNELDNLVTDGRGREMPVFGELG